MEKIEKHSFESHQQSNPCLNCGACCAYYLISFYWAEADDVYGGTVPVELTERFQDLRRVMRGTNQKNPRCQALRGELGKEVCCLIYEKRPSICRKFKISWEDGVVNELCDRARISRGLSPLEPTV